MRSGNSNFIVCGTTWHDVAEFKQLTKCAVNVMYYSHGWLGPKKSVTWKRCLVSCCARQFWFPTHLCFLTRSLWTYWTLLVLFWKSVWAAHCCQHRDKGMRKQIKRKKATKPRALSATTRQTEKEKRWMSLFSLSSCTGLRTALPSR